MLECFDVRVRLACRDAGVKAIESLMLKKGMFGYILLETTGLADPGPITAMFWRNADLGSDIYIYLEGIPSPPFLPIIILIFQPIPHSLSLSPSPSPSPSLIAGVITLIDSKYFTKVPDTLV